MSYQVLARKYRPTHFEELEGQEHVLRALINALEQNRLHHAYLFTGTRGVGKTTIARILAKCLNCETGVTARPCEECSSCQEIAQGRSVDLIEVDAASRTRVEDTRELLDNVQYLPTRSRFKVYLIDEVHMLSNHSFNALLKTLEEPPDHVKFLLATTDPKKLPITVLSRCLQFNLKNLSPERIVSYLKSILPKEGIEFDEPALWQLGRAADGSMRDALSLTDQAISFGENRLSDTDVRAMLGAIDQREVYGLLDRLIEKDAPGLLEKVASLAEFGPDFEMLLSEMLSVLHRVAVAQAVPDGIDNSQGDKELVEAVASALPIEDVQLYYQIGLIGSRDLPLAPDPREGFEMVMLRMLSFAPDDAPPDAPGGGSSNTESPTGKRSPVSDILSKIGGASETKAQAVNDQPAAVAAEAPSAKPEESAPAAATNVSSLLSLIEKTNAGAASTSTPAEAAADASAPDAPAPDTTAPDISAPLESKRDEAQVDKDASATDDESEDNLPPLALMPADWTGLFNQLKLGGVTRTLAANCELTAVEGATCVLTLGASHGSLLNKVHESRIREALAGHLGRPVNVRIEIGEVNAETPAQAAEREAEEARVRAVSAIENDENVQRLIETFDGKLNVDSIVPLANRRHAGE